MTTHKIATEHVKTGQSGLTTAPPGEDVLENLEYNGRFAYHRYMNDDERLSALLDAHKGGSLTTEEAKALIVEMYTAAPPTTPFNVASQFEANWRPSQLYQGLRREGDPESFFLRAWEERLAPEMIQKLGRPTQNEVARVDPKLIRGLRNKYAGNLGKLAELVPPAKPGPSVKPLPAGDEAARALAAVREGGRKRAAAHYERSRK